jgi:hypothetical protein
MNTGRRDRRLADPEKFRARERARYAANPQTRLTTNDAWRRANPVEANAGRRRWKKANPAKVAKINKVWRDENKERARETGKAWKARNLTRRRATNAATERKRQLKIKQQTPAWADLRRIAEFYANCPPGHHVDHVVPVNGRTVCGLHCEANLQYLTDRENWDKGNRYP